MPRSGVKDKVRQAVQLMTRKSLENASLHAKNSMTSSPTARIQPSRKPTTGDQEARMLTEESPGLNEKCMIIPRTNGRNQSGSNRKDKARSMARAMRKPHRTRQR